MSQSIPLSEANHFLLNYNQTTKIKSLNEKTNLKKKHKIKRKLSTSASWVEWIIKKVCLMFSNFPVSNERFDDFYLFVDDLLWRTFSN